MGTQYGILQPVGFIQSNDLQLSGKEITPKQVVVDGIQIEMGQATYHFCSKLLLIIISRSHSDAANEIPRWI